MGAAEMVGAWGVSRQGQAERDPVSADQYLKSRGQGDEARLWWCPAAGQGALAQTGAQGVPYGHEIELCYEGGRALAELPREAGESLSLEMLGTQLDTLQAAVGICFEGEGGGVGLHWGSFRSPF